MTSCEALLIANVRSHFAEFLNQRSPERLSMLYSPTCVSFSTVSLNLTLIGFSWTFFKRLPKQVVEPCGYGLFQKPDLYPNDVPELGILKKLRNIDLMPIVYACQPRLRNRLTLGGFTFPRKP